MSIAKQIEAEIERLGYAYNYYGLRAVAADDPIAVGECAAPSYQWVDGERTDNELAGVCAIALPWHSDCDTADIEAALRIVKGYDGARIVLLGASQRDWGEDPGEIVMENAVALAEWQAETR